MLLQDYIGMDIYTQTVRINYSYKTSSYYSNVCVPIFRNCMDTARHSIYSQKHVKFANHISSFTASWSRDCLNGEE